MFRGCALRFLALVTVLLGIVLPAAPGASSPPGLSQDGLPAELRLPAYTPPILPGRDYDPELPSPESLLGFPLGARPASGDQLVAAFEAIAASSPRAQLFRYGFSHEGRPLIYAVLGAEEKLVDLAGLRAKHALLADAATDDEALAGVIDEAPAVLWIGAAVHGNEASGADAALALLYHLAACRDEEWTELLDEFLVLIDPVQNPDGRARFYADFLRWNGRIRSTDRQSLSHQNGWPSARGNHYFLDLNRDWIALTQPETRGKLRVFLDWHPQVSFDLHEMGAYDSYLFSPPREPYNPYLPGSTHAWWRDFAEDMGRAFGTRGWSCYTGDWNEEFNPNRGAAWPLHLGAVALLAEQASPKGTAVKRPDGSLLSYAEAVHHQLEAVLSLLRSAARGRVELHRDYVAVRRSRGADRDDLRAYVISNEMKPGAARRLATTLAAQDIRVMLAQENFRLPEARSYWGELRGDKPFPAGSFIVDLEAGEGRLARALLDFDPALGDEFLGSERRLLEKGEDSQLYENTAWSLAMTHGCEVFASSRRPGVLSIPFEGGPRFAGTLSPLPSGQAPYGWLLDMAASGAAEALAGLHAAGVRCWAVSEPFQALGRAYGAGTVLVKRTDNEEDVTDALAAVARRSGLEPQPIASALTQSGPDLGSRQARLIAAPRVALLGGPPFHASSFGALWHFLDQELSLPVSLLRLSQLRSAELSRYNVIIVPDAGASRGKELLAMAGSTGRERLEAWIEAGGTLISIGAGNELLFDAEQPLGSLRPRRRVLAELGDYLEEARREAALPGLSVDETLLRRSDREPPGESEIPAVPALPDTSVAGDEYRRRFHPIGAICRVDLDPDHWLSAGVGSRLPVLVKTDLCLMSRRPAETVGRFAEAGKLRLSGLLWPEAAERWALSSYLARERLGRGQIIAFLGNPAYRAQFHGSARLLANAVLLGPGMGSRIDAGW